MGNWMRSQYCWKQDQSKAVSRYLLISRSSKSSPCFLVRWVRPPCTEEAGAVVSPLPVHWVCVQQVIWPPKVTEYAKDLVWRLSQVWPRALTLFILFGAVQHRMWYELVDANQICSVTSACSWVIFDLLSGGGDGGDEHNREETDGFQFVWGKMQINKDVCRASQGAFSDWSEPNLQMWNLPRTKEANKLRREEEVPVWTKLKHSPDFFFIVSTFHPLTGHSGRQPAHEEQPWQAA